MNENNNITLSKYAMELQGSSKIRYVEKITPLKFDPYLNLMKYNEQLLPDNITFFEIYQYFVNRKSYYSAKELKAYKSLDSFKSYQSGWVKYLAGQKILNDFIVFGKVLHSQALNLPPLKVWIHLGETGLINTAHCTCVAGLGESCSHVGAVLFALHAIYLNISENDTKSVTDIKAYWVVPSCKLSVQLCNENIEYSSRKKAKLCLTNRDDINISKRADMINVISKLVSKGKTPVALLGVDEFLPAEEDAADFELDHLLEVYLSNLWSSDNEAKSLDTLISMFSFNNFTMLEEKVNLIEQATRQQAKGDYWHKLRLGRITASTFKLVCKSKDDKFPLGLLKKICYPSNHLRTIAIKYGCKHEQIALKTLIKEQGRFHSNLKLSPSGLVIFSRVTFYAASPDAIWSCSCCGIMPVEVKCPFCFRDGDIATYLARKTCPIFLNDDGTYAMTPNHEYYYQVQLQGYILQTSFAYLFIYSGKTKILVKVPISKSFVEENMKKTDNVFIKYIFPELLGKYYTKNQQ